MIPLSWLSLRTAPSPSVRWSGSLPLLTHLACPVTSTFSLNLLDQSTIVGIFIIEDPLLNSHRGCLVMNIAWVDVSSFAHCWLLPTISWKGDVVHISICASLKHTLSHAICRVAFSLTVYPHCAECIRHKPLQLVNSYLPPRSKTVSHIPVVLFWVLLSLLMGIQEELCIGLLLPRLLFLLISNNGSDIADCRLFIIWENLWVNLPLVICSSLPSLGHSWIKSNPIRSPILIVNWAIGQITICDHVAFSAWSQTKSNNKCSVCQAEQCSRICSSNCAFF